MAITKISRNLLDTGISDSSDATAITIDSSERVGIGTTSPDRKLHLNEAASSTSNFIHLTTADTGTTGSNGFLVGIGSAGGAELWNYEAQSILFATSSTERMRIDSGGHVLVNTTSEYSGTNGNLTVPLQLDIGANDANLKTLFFNRNAAEGEIGGIAAGVTGFSTMGRINFVAEGVSGGSQASSIRFKTTTGASESERMRLTAAGRLFVGTTASVDAGFFIVKADASTYNHIVTQPTATASYNALAMVSGGGTRIGAISVGTSTNSITYGGTSDYRLKENIVPMEKGLERVKKLKPVKFDWKEDGSSSEGFIAHEIQEAGWEVGVEGHKDGEEMQMVEYGKLTPLLVKAIQEQQEQIEALQSEINKLKGG